jgi:AraC-like DNA-binding protein
VEHPWWQTPTAYALYALLIILVVLLSFRIYRHLLQRRSREAMLLLQIQNLIEQVNRNEHSEAAIVLNEPTAQDQETESEPSAQDKEFMARATQLVEQHLSSPQYGVKHLAADLCMERTGLYKKLTLMMQQSPVAFIRSIRLHRAAEMLQSGDMTVTDVAERSGFCSTSYFSKCFQKEFGCKPSEYIGR